MLSGDISLMIPGVRNVMDKLDAQKEKFLAIPSNVRAALDKLGRIRLLVGKNGPVTVEFQNVSVIVEQNLKQTQIQWETSAERFSELDTLRKTGGVSVSGDTILLASQLLTSVGYVVKNANNNIAAVDKLGAKYLTTEQQKQLSLNTVGVSGSSIPLLALVGVGYLIFRRR